MRLAQINAVELRITLQDEGCAKARAAQEARGV
jgi:hypothetical protein